MWPITHTETTTAAPETVWRCGSTCLDGRSGTRGWVDLARRTVRGRHARTHQARAARRGRSRSSRSTRGGFTDETRLPLCRLRFAHELSTTDDGRTAITITVSFHGLLRPLFQRVIGKDIAADLAAQTARLARAAEGQPAPAAPALA